MLYGHSWDDNFKEDTICLGQTWLDNTGTDQPPSLSPEPLRSVPFVNQILIECMGAVLGVMLTVEQLC